MMGKVTHEKKRGPRMNKRKAKAKNPNSFFSEVCMEKIERVCEGKKGVLWYAVCFVINSQKQLKIIYPLYMSFFSFHFNYMMMMYIFMIFFF